MAVALAVVVAVLAAVLFASAAVAQNGAVAAVVGEGRGSSGAAALRATDLGITRLGEGGATSAAAVPGLAGLAVLALSAAVVLARHHPVRAEPVPGARR